MKSKNKPEKQGDCGGSHETLNVPMKAVGMSNPNASSRKTSGTKQHPCPESLSKEIETYEKNKKELLEKGRGKYVLIKGEEIINIFDTYADAVKVGFDKFGNSPFLVKQIVDVEPNRNFTSNLIKVGASCLL